jgi:hypothetical protein
MKCIKSVNSGKIIKVSNDKAYEMVNIKQTHTYISRKQWKEQVRDKK